MSSSDAEVNTDVDTQVDSQVDAQVENKVKYIKDDYDYSKYAEDFSRDEFSYYNIIKSYAGSSIILSLTINKTVLSLSSLSENGMVTEYLRNDEAVNNTYTTIFAWVKDVNGPTDISYVLDNVYINDDVSLWVVLEDMKDIDEEEADNEFHDKEEAEELKMEEMRLSAIVNILCMFNVCIVIIYALTVIVAIDTHKLNPITYEKL